MRVILACVLSAVSTTPASAQGVEAPGGRMAGAEVTVEIVDTVARVEARYRLEGSVPLELRTHRGPGRRMVEIEAESGMLPWGIERTPGQLPWRVEASPGLVRIRFEAPTDSSDLAWYRHRNRVPPEPGPPAWEIRIAYRVTGDLERIPLFVPELATDVNSRLELRVRGLAPGADLDGAFPRFEWVGAERGAREGPVAVARPPNLPTFLLLPRRATLLTLNEAADLLVVVVVLGATVGWLLWRRRQAGRIRTDGGSRRTASEAGSRRPRKGPGAGRPKPEP